MKTQPKNNKQKQENIREVRSKTFASSKKTRALVLRALLLGLAFVLSALDHSMPNIFVGVPQMSLGLSNLVVLFALIFLSTKDAVFITVAKSFSVIFMRGPVAFYLSISGGLLALLVEILLWKLSREQVSLILLSALGGLSHNIGQIIVYGFYADVNVTILIAPLSLLGIASGILTAFILKALYPYFLNWLNSDKRLVREKKK